MKPVDAKTNGHAHEGNTGAAIVFFPGVDPLTTGEAAKICRVSQQTIIRCFDNGQLRGYRVPPLRKHRRIPRDNLRKFMKDNAIPTDRLDGDVPSDPPIDESTSEVGE